MRGIILLITVLVVSGVSAQDLPLSQVPTQVINTFNARFPAAITPTWQEIKPNYFQTKFEVNHVSHAAVLDGTGMLVMSKFKVLPANMPAAIKHTLDTGYKEYKIGDMEQLNNMGVILYQVELLGKSPQQQLLMTSDGRLAAAPIFR